MTRGSRTTSCIWWTWSDARLTTATVCRREGRPWGRHPGGGKPFFIARRKWCTICARFTAGYVRQKPAEPPDRPVAGGGSGLRQRPDRTRIRERTAGCRREVRATLPASGPHGVVTSWGRRSSLCRSAAQRRTPSAVVSRKMIASNDSIKCAGHRTSSFTAGRFFFIWMAVV